MNIHITARTEADTRELGRRLAGSMRPGEILFLTGDLGAGKSVLARGVAEGLGVEGPMPSPTFTLMQPYEGRLPVYHFDLYRLDGPQELFDAGLEDFLYGGGVSLVEWPLNALTDADATARADIRVREDGVREIDFEQRESPAPARQAGTGYRSVHPSDRGGS